YPRIFNAQTACCCIPGIGEWRKIFFYQVLVVPVKIMLVHQYLTPDLYLFNAILAKCCPQRKSMNLPCVQCDIVSRLTITAGYGFHKKIVFVYYRYAGTIKLRLHAICYLSQSSQFTNLSIPFLQIALV